MLGESGFKPSGPHGVAAFVAMRRKLAGKA
jgi:hypothetical protein